MRSKNVFCLTLPLFALCCALGSVSVFAQQSAEAAQAASGTTSLPRQFRRLALGMALDDLKDGLKKDGLFNFRGDRDVSLLPQRNQSLVETAGSSFVRRAFFQLRDGSVFIMAYSLNTETVDYYSIFTAFTQKYGAPQYLDPKEAVWENDETRVALERPLTVKYIDKKIFNDIVSESALGESREARAREDFINEF
jgi:hypothetical protein